MLCKYFSYLTIYLNYIAPNLNLRLTRPVLWLRAINSRASPLQTMKTGDNTSDSTVGSDEGNVEVNQQAEESDQDEEMDSEEPRNVRFEEEWFTNHSVGRYWFSIFCRYGHNTL